ncbi:LacI family DNA-binding transcriptional regulator [Aurantiacibacter aquimixticola]|uniref:LacI family transcriptional regulator n=1 Tax=Aurantiacibacter aquimixticola TaxID=1958945 RepID=A0A419RR61_9SPHN|nr:LacI family DNA-binding transcriptional regulator [Aurantiacibacter aquimixticola]RJY08293.1 LacI family transcriptional regulator [Aurantiacibacter aquimixticola]
MSQSAAKPRVTSFEVAERAGVNQSTVSRALSGDPSITEQTRERVREAADALGYRVDARAARLRSGKTRTIAIVVITRPGMGATEINPFHYNLLGSTCAAASDMGYQALVSFQSEAGHFDGDYVETRQADGVVLLGTSTNDAAWDYHHAMLGRADVASWGSPFVDHPRVDSDNRQGARLAVERLLAGGHRQIAFIGDTREIQNQFRERYDSYCDVMGANELEHGPPVWVEGKTRVEQGRLSAAALIDSGRRFDGIFCSCDAMALGVLELLHERGVGVPDEVGVIGFDGLGSGAYSNPPLTTVEPDFRQAGVLLAEAALGESDAAKTRRVPVQLVERESVRKTR